MQIDILTHVKIIYSIEDYQSLIKEIDDFLENDDSEIYEVIKNLKEDLESSVHILSPFTISTTVYFEEISDFFIDIQDDIEDIDNNDYPHLSELLITIGNKV